MAKEGKQKKEKRKKGGGRKPTPTSIIRKERLKLFMKREGLNQITLSKKSGLTQQSISNMLKTTKISDYVISVIISAFPEYREQWFLGYDNYPTHMDKENAEKRARKQHIDSLSSVPYSLDMFISAIAKSMGYEMRELPNDIGIDIDAHLYEIANSNGEVFLVQNDEIAKRILHYAELELTVFLSSLKKEDSENG